MNEDSQIESGAAVAEFEEQRTHRTAVWVLITLGTIIMVLSTLSTWVERQLLNTDAWVETSTALLDDDLVRHEMSVRLVNALYENVDVGPAIDENLPEQLQGLGRPLAGLLRGPLVDTTDTLLASEPVRVVWIEANRSAHAAVVAILEDNVADNISAAGGKVVIDLGGILRKVGEQIGLPQPVLDAIGEDAGRFEVVDSDALAAAQDGVSVIKILSTVTFLLVLILYGAAVYLADNWRRVAARNVGLAIALGGFIALVGLRLGIAAIAGSPATLGGRNVAESVLAIGTALLRRTAWSEIMIGLLVALGASLLGPAPYAKRARHYTARGFRRSALAMWIGFACLILLALAWSPSASSGNWLMVLIVVALVVVGIEALRRTSLADEAAAQEASADRTVGAASVGSSAAEVEASE
jgi:hypothetical protein